MNKKERLLQRIASKTVCEWSESGSVTEISSVDYKTIANAYSNLNEFYSILAPLIIDQKITIENCSCCDEKIIVWKDAESYLETQFSKN